MAMSGGIDSSVAALLLQQQNYDLVGVTFCNMDSFCQNQQGATELDEARALADKLGIEHHVLDVREVFRKTVIQNFIDEYLCCRTPNPCVICNPVIKWGQLLQFADEMNCQWLATGHYAQIGCKNDRHFVRKGKDVRKDQSYFLWKLKDEFLRRTIFPLGGLTKQEVRELAAQNGFVSLSEKKESEEICFVPDDNYRTFLKENVPDLDEKMKPGKMVDKEGKVLGQHCGLYNYTIGQRRGLGIALGIPAYVVGLDEERNRVIIGSREDLMGRELRVRDANIVKYPDFKDGQQVGCRIRYRSRGVRARLYHDGDYVRAELEAPVDSITPGQSAVFYEGDDLLGGGIIM
mgnify:CR=1 FL=1